MQTELIQLLQHKDYNNVKLGCYLAIANGYNDVDIVDNMNVLEDEYDDIQIVKSIWFIAYRFDIISFLDNCTVRYCFKLWNIYDHTKYDKEITISIEQYNKTYTQYAEMFVKLIMESE